MILLHRSKLEEENKMADDEMARVVKVRPGSANHAFIARVVPAEMADKPLTEIVKYVMDKDDMTQDSIQVAGRVKTEMGGDFGMTVNGTVVKGKEAGNDYFVQKVSNQGVKYLEMEVIVASKQEGGFRVGGIEYKI